MKRTYDLSCITPNESYSKVSLVERNPEPFGHKLVNISSTFRDLTAELTELTKEVEKADVFVHAAAVNRLEMIAEQMKFLQTQACKVVVELRRGVSLNHVACNFRKIPGKTYHLYQRPSGQKYFSMLSPEEWTTMPHDFLGSFRLENDWSWTPVEEIERKEKNLKAIDSILNSNILSRDINNDTMFTDSHGSSAMLIDSQSEKMLVDSQSDNMLVESQ